MAAEVGALALVYAVAGCWQSSRLCVCPRVRQWDYRPVFRAAATCGTERLQKVSSKPSKQRNDQAWLGAHPALCVTAASMLKTNGACTSFNGGDRAMTVWPAGVRVRPVSASFHDAAVNFLPFFCTVSLPERRYSSGCSTSNFATNARTARRCRSDGCGREHSGASWRYGRDSSRRTSQGWAMDTTWVIFTALRRSTDRDAPARMGGSARICVVLSWSVARSASIASMPCAVAHRFVHTCCALAGAQHPHVTARASSSRHGRRAAAMARGPSSPRHVALAVSIYRWSAITNQASKSERRGDVLHGPGIEAGV